MSMGHTLLTDPYTVGRMGRGELQGLSTCYLFGGALPKHLVEFRDGALGFRNQCVVEPLTFQDCL